MPNFSSVVRFNNSIGPLVNSLVRLLSENITATHNKHAWETGKPKNLEIDTNLGMRKLALRSICATFSPVTPPPPPFLLISEKLMSSATRKCNLFENLSDHFEYHEVFCRFIHNQECDFKHTSEVRGLFRGGRVVKNWQ